MHRSSDLLSRTGLPARIASLRSPRSAAAARDGRPPWRGETVVASSRPLSVRHILEAASDKRLVGRNKPARRTVLPSLYPHDTGSDFDRRRGQNWIGGFRALRPVRSRIWRKSQSGSPSQEPKLCRLTAGEDWIRTMVQLRITRRHRPKLLPSARRAFPWRF